MHLLAGGTCLEDLELRRNDEVYLDALGAQRIPDPTTAGDFCRRFEEAEVEILMNSVNDVRVKVWRRQPASFLEEAIIDGEWTKRTRRTYVHPASIFTAVLVSAFGIRLSAEPRLPASRTMRQAGTAQAGDSASGVGAAFVCGNAAFGIRARSKGESRRPMTGGTAPESLDEATFTRRFLVLDTTLRARARVSQRDTSAMRRASRQGSNLGLSPPKATPP